MHAMIWKILQESGDFTWRVSDCEELSGSYSQEMMELVLEGVIFVLHLPVFQRCFLYCRNIFRSTFDHPSNSLHT